MPGFDMALQELEEAEAVALQLGPALMKALVQVYSETTSVQTLEMAHRGFLGLIRVAVSAGRYMACVHAANPRLATLGLLAPAYEKDPQECLNQLLGNMTQLFEARFTGATAATAATGATQGTITPLERHLKTFSQFFLKRSMREGDGAKGLPFLVASLFEMVDALDPETCPVPRRRSMRFMCEKVPPKVHKATEKMAQHYITALMGLCTATTGSRVEHLQYMCNAIWAEVEAGPSMIRGIFQESTRSASVSTVVGHIEAILADTGLVLRHLDDNRTAAKWARVVHTLSEGHIYSDDEEDVSDFRAATTPRSGIFGLLKEVASMVHLLLLVAEGGLEFATEMKLLSLCGRLYKLQVRLADMMNARPGLGLSRHYKDMMSVLTQDVTEAVAARLKSQLSKTRYKLQAKKRKVRRTEGENDDPQDHVGDGEDTGEDDEEDDPDDVWCVDTDGSKSKKRNIDKQGKVIPGLVFQVETLDARLIKMVKTVSIIDKVEVSNWIRKSSLRDIRIK